MRQIDFGDKAKSKEPKTRAAELISRSRHFKSLVASATVTAAATVTSTTTAAAAIAAATPATAATTASAATTKATTAAATTAAKATTTGGAWTSFIDGQRAAVQRRSIHLSDGAFRQLVVGKLDESKAAGLAAFAIANDVDCLYRTVALESRPKSIVRCVERQIPYIQILHGICLKYWAF